MRAGTVRRAGCAGLLGLLVLTISACSDGSGSGNGDGASCASEIAVAGTTYVAGRGAGATSVPGIGAALHGVIPPCGDGNEPSRPETAHTIPGVSQADAVVGPGGDVMVAERLWELPRSGLPAELQPYVRP